MEVEIEADSPADAKNTVERDYTNGKHTLDSSNLKQINFTARSAERSRSYGR